jgi:hypothetical protein
VEVGYVLLLTFDILVVNVDGLTAAGYAPLNAQESLFAGLLSV